MQWLFAALAGIGFVELMIHLPIFATLAEFRTILVKVSAVIRSDRISDHWKEKSLPKYAFRIFKITLLTAIYLFAALMPFFALLAIAILMTIPFLQLAMSWTGIVFITIVAAAYAKARSAFVPAKP